MQTKAKNTELDGWDTACLALDDLRMHVQDAIQVMDLLIEVDSYDLENLLDTNGPGGPQYVKDNLKKVALFLEKMKTVQSSESMKFRDYEKRIQEHMDKANEAARNSQMQIARNRLEDAFEVADNWRHQSGTMREEAVALRHLRRISTSIQAVEEYL